MHIKDLIGRKIEYVARAPDDRSGTMLYLGLKGYGFITVEEGELFDYEGMFFETGNLPRLDEVK